MAKEVDLAFLAGLAASFNIDLDVAEIDTVDVIEEKREVRKVSLMIEQEGVLRQLHHRHSLTMKTCVYCKGTFQTNYCYVEHCSAECRDRAFKAQYGISWASLRSQITPPQSFWEYEDTIILVPKLVEELYYWAKNFIKDYDQIRKESLEQNQETLLVDQERLDSLLAWEPESSEPEALIDSYTEDSLSLELDDDSQSSLTSSVPVQFDLDSYSVDSFDF